VVISSGMHPDSRPVSTKPPTHQFIAPAGRSSQLE
jgi:hypothetical protein